jgi:hypothetical protein
MQILRITPVALLAAFSMSANADVLRCGGQIIEEGDSRIKVLKHCGEPVMEEGARWYYNKSNDVMTVLHFAADKVSYIEDERD